MSFRHTVSALTFLLLIMIILIGGCKTGYKGDELANLPPETYTVVDTIIRIGEDRLNSQVEIRWWGDDPDGFIVGYEYTFAKNITAATVWNFTAITDSVFLLSPPPGQDTVDFTFWVRAVDNNELVDPSPAQLTYPVKNTPPFVAFSQDGNIPTKTFPVLKYNFTGSDPDGEQTISHYEIVLNDTTDPALVIPANATAVTLVAQTPKANTSDADIYINNSTTPLGDPLMGLLMNQENQLYIRVVDKSASSSAWAASTPVFVKKVNSDVLLVNAYTPPNSQVEQFYAQQMINNGISVFDTLQIFEQVAGENTQLAPDNLTQERIFNLFEVIVWFGNNAERSLSLAQRTSAQFFNSGGRMFMSIYVSSSFDEQSQFLEFTPALNLVVPQDTTLILNNSAPLTPQVAGWPVLSSQSIVGVVRPMLLEIGAEPLYNADLIAKDNSSGTLSPWSGESTVVSRKKSGSQTTFIFSTLEMQSLNGNGMIDEFFEKVLKDEFSL